MGSLGGVSTAVFASEGDASDVPGAVIQESFADSGDTSQIAAIKTQLPKLLRDDAAAGRLTTGELADQSQLQSEDAVEGREQLTEKVWAPSEVAGQSATLEEGIDLVADDPTYEPYVSNKFVVESWQGVRVDGIQSYAQLAGHQEYKNEDGSWDVDLSKQYQVHLISNSDVGAVYSWLLSDKAAVRLGGS